MLLHWAMTSALWRIISILMGVVSSSIEHQAFKVNTVDTLWLESTLPHHNRGFSFYVLGVCNFLLWLDVKIILCCSCFSSSSLVPTTERCQSCIEVLGTLWASLGSTGTGDPPPGLMGKEEFSDPFSPAAATQPLHNYTAGVSVFAWSITSQSLHLLLCAHRL